MAKTRTDYRQQVSRLIRDGAGVLKPGDIDDLIDRANETYSKTHPRTLVVDLASDGSGEFAVSALTGFDQEFSGDVAVEYPISTSGEPNVIDRRYWKFYDKPGGRVIRMDDAPAAAAMVRFTFKAQHVIDEDGSTIPESKFNSFSKLAAAEGCDDLGQHYTQTVENQMFGDAGPAFYTTKAGEYKKRAKEYRTQANKDLGLDEKGVQAASVTKNWDAKGTGLTHGKRFR